MTFLVERQGHRYILDILGHCAIEDGPFPLSLQKAAKNGGVAGAGCLSRNFN
jgi:hypothetical protein